MRLTSTAAVAVGWAKLLGGTGLQERASAEFVKLGLHVLDPAKLQQSYGPGEHFEAARDVLALLLYHRTWLADAPERDVRRWHNHLRERAVA